MEVETDPTVFEALCSLDVAFLLKRPLLEIRPILPCLSRMLLCNSLDKSQEWEEKQGDLMQLLSGIEDVNAIVLLLSVDFHVLEVDAKAELKARQKAAHSKSVITTNLQKHGLIQEFERCEPERKLRILISDLTAILSAQMTNYPFLIRKATLASPSYLHALLILNWCPMSSVLQSQVLIEVLDEYLRTPSQHILVTAACLLSMYYQHDIQINRVADAVASGEDCRSSHVSNNPSSLVPICQCLIKNHITDDTSVPKSTLKVIQERKKSAIESLCRLNPVMAANIREFTVEYCKMPSLAISLTLNFIMKDTQYDDGRVSKLVTFISGLLLGSNTKVRSWFASFIKTTQDVKPNLMRQEIEKELYSMVQSSEIQQLTSAMDCSQDSMGKEDDLINSMCLLSEEQCLRATTLIRLCCALKAIAGLKFSETESDLVLRLITCFPPLTAAGIRFMSLSLSMLLACSALIVDKEKEKQSVNWIKWLASRSSELQNAGPEGGSFAEQLLLMAIHLHSDQRPAVAQLACSTLGMRIKVPTSSLTRMRQIFTEEVFTTQVVAAHAVNVPVTKSLNGNMTGYLPIHCVYQLLKSRAFSKSRVSIKEWIYKQICTTSSPLHPQLPSLVRQYVSTVVTPHAKAQDDGMLNDPLTEKEITDVFDSKIAESSLSTRLLILYYVLLYQDSVLNHMKTLVTLQSAPKRYPTSLINAIPVKLLLHKAQREPQSSDKLYPALLGLLHTHLPHLCQVEDWIAELDMAVLNPKDGSLVTSGTMRPRTSKLYSPDLLYQGLSHADVNPALALMHLRALTSAKVDPELTIPYAEPLTRGFSKLLEESVSRRVKQEACNLWRKLNSVIPCNLWVLTCNALRRRSAAGSAIKQPDIILENLVEDPLVILGLDDRIFRNPEILSVVLRMVGACLAASRVHYRDLVKSNPTTPSIATSAIPTRSATPTLNPAPVNDGEKEELCSALVSAQESGAIQILIEACLPTQKDFDLAASIGVQRKGEGIPGNLLSSLREIHCLICCTLHQMFIADPKVAKLVHFQGYPSELIPVFVGGVPSMHICLDFVPELLQQKDIGKQLFAIQLSSHLSVHFPVPKSLSIARLCVNVLATFVTVLPAHQRCEFLSLALSAIRRFATAFPPLLRDCISILLHISKISKCHLAAHDTIVSKDLVVDEQDDDDGKALNQWDAHAKLHRHARKTFNLIVEDAMSKR